MDIRISAEDWKTTEMIRAENALFDAVDRAEKEMAEVDRRMAEMEADDKPAGKIEALTEFATGPVAPAELRAAVEQVNAGQLTREQALADPRIASNPLATAALDAATQAGVDDSGHDTAAPATPRPRRAAQRPDYDEEDFSTHTVLRDW
jgi:hypothetical protein